MCELGAVYACVSVRAQIAVVCVYREKGVCTSVSMSASEILRQIDSSKESGGV